MVYETQISVTLLTMPPACEAASLCTIVLSWGSAVHMHYAEEIAIALKSLVCDNELGKSNC